VAGAELIPSGAGSPCSISGFSCVLKRNRGKCREGLSLVILSHGGGGAVSQVRE